MKLRWRLTLGLLLLLSLSFLFPTVRWRILGWARGEAFYRGRPTSYWQREVKEWTGRVKSIRAQNIVSPDIALRPSPASWCDELEESFTQTFSTNITAPLIDDPSALPVVVELLSKDDPDVREYVARTIGRMGLNVQIVMPHLIRLLDDSSPEVRLSATAALVRIAPPPEVAISILRHEDPLVRRRVANLLVEVGPVAIPALREALNDPDDQVRAEAAAALQKILSAGDAP